MKKHTNEEIDKAFNDIDKSYETLMRKNKEALENAMIKPIHEKFPLSQNGICALIAKMGSGKSFLTTKMMIQQEVLFNEPFFELVVICSTSAKFDETVETFKPLIKKSKLVCIKDTDLLGWVNKYIRRVLKYNSMMKYVLSHCKISNDEVERLFLKHGIKKPKKQLEYLARKFTKYNWSTYPHRCLLILDDFASHPLLRSKETELSRLLKKLRHFNINVMICVQTTKSLPKDIKRTLSDIILFPGIGEEDFMDLMKESPASKFDRKKLWSLYNQIKDPHGTFGIYINADKILINQKNIINKS